MFEIEMPQSATIESWRGVRCKIMLLVRIKGRREGGREGGRKGRVTLEIWRGFRCKIMLLVRREGGREGGEEGVPILTPQGDSEKKEGEGVKTTGGKENTD